MSMRRWTARQRLKNDWIQRAVHALVRAAGLLPLAFAARAGGAVGRLAALLSRRERRGAVQACAAALSLPARDAARVVRRAYASIGRAAFELCRAIRHPEALLSRVHLPDADRRRLDDALSCGRGVVFVTGHLGSWELLAWALARAGYPIHTVAAPSYDPRLTRLVRRLRRERGVHSIFRSAPGAAARMIRVLRRGHVLGTLIDQSTRVPSVDVPFFGRPAPTPVGAATLALRLGAEVVAGFLVRTEGGGYVARIRRIPVTRRGETDVADNTARMTRAIEDAVRDAPEQWVWMHRRWDRRADLGS
jgi:KDO2-lipid IV(A) lauroyltransferase